MQDVLKICTFEVSGREVPGILDDNSLVDISSLGNSFMDQVIKGEYEKIVSTFASLPRYSYSYSKLRLPIRPSEIWGAGVTYLRSRDARETETVSKGLYDFIYSATRPELFLKDSGRRVVGPGDAIAVRSDSNWTVPEPELAVVLNSECNILGYTVANDVSARDIEGQSPLYLPQSKTYKNSCAIGPVIVTKDEIADPRNLTINLRVLRRGSTVFQGQVSTSQMKRTIEELIYYLRKDNAFSGWVILMTGTGIVPPDDFSLQDGDVVETEIEKIGILRNPVIKLGG